MLMRQATGLKRKGGMTMAMYKYILNKINKYHQEITVDDKYWAYLKADEVQDELDDLEEYEQVIVEQYLKYVQDDLEEVLEKLASNSIWLREENSWKSLIRELGAEGFWGDSFEALEDYLNYDKLADFLIKKGAFKDVPPMFLDCIDNEELGNKLMEGDTLYLLETGADGFTEHIHKYESGCYWDCYSRILYKID